MGNASPQDPLDRARSGEAGEQEIEISSDAIRRLGNLVGEHSVEELSVPRHMPMPEGFLARPKDDQVWPAVIILHDAWGLSDSVKRMSVRLAKAGFVVHAPDFYGGRVASDAKAAASLAAMVSREEALQIVEQSLHSLRREWFVKCGRVAVLGIGSGGRFGIEAAGCLPQISALILAFGEVPASAGQADGIGCPVLVLADNRAAGGVSEAERAKSVFANCRPEGEMSVCGYDGAAFFENLRQGYLSAAAAAGPLEKIIEFLNVGLGGGLMPRKEKKFFFFEKKFSGIREARYADGAVKVSAAYKDDRPHGPYREFYPGGDLKAERCFQRGRIHGPVREYYSGGKVRAQYQCRDGILEGEAVRYFESGKLEEKMVYAAGRPDGEIKVYYENGSTRSEAFYRDGEKEDTAKEFYPNGLLWCQATYEQGRQKKIMVCGQNGGILWKQ